MNLITAVAAGADVLNDKRMAQQLAGRPSPSRISLQAASNEVPELSRSGGRGLGRLRHTDSTHEASPIPLPSHRKWKSTQIEFQNAHP